MLSGYIDVYLPDLKYYTDKYSIEYSSAPHYFETATKAICEMINQVGIPTFDENGIIQKGVIIRHLVLPGHLTETKNILNWMKNNLPKDTYISIMAQYFPTYKAKDHSLLNRKLSQREYDFVLNMISEFENGYIQELGSHEEEYVPNFNLEGI